MQRIVKSAARNFEKHQPPPHFGVHVAQCVALFCCCFWDFVDNTKIGPWLNNTQFIVLWLQELSKQHIFFTIFFSSQKKKIELKKKSCHSAVGKLFIVFLMTRVSEWELWQKGRLIRRSAECFEYWVLSEITFECVLQVLFDMILYWHF